MLELPPGGGLPGKLCAGGKKSLPCVFARRNFHGVLGMDTP
jgi:hypothetical protein